MSDEARPQATANPGDGGPLRFAVRRLSPELRERVVGFSREGTRVLLRDREPLRALGLACVGVALVGLVGAVLVRPPFEVASVHGASAAGVALAICVLGVGLVGVGLARFGRRLVAPLGPMLATGPGLGLASTGDGRAVLFRGSHLTSEPGLTKAVRARRLRLELAGGALELRTREGPLLDMALAQLSDPTEEGGELAGRIRTEAPGAVLPWPAPRPRAARALLGTTAVAGVLGSVAFWSVRVAGARQLDAIVERVRAERKADRERLALAPRPRLASLHLASVAGAGPEGEDAAPLYRGLVRDLTKLQTPETPMLQSSSDAPDDDARAELERRRPFLPTALRAAAASRCQLTVAADEDEAFDVTQWDAVRVPDLLTAAAFDALARSRPLEGATLAVASLRAIADLEPLGCRSDERGSALEALDLAASRSFGFEESEPGDERTALEALAGDLEALEATFPDAPARVRRDGARGVLAVAMTARHARCPTEVLSKFGISPREVLGLWRWFPTESWSAPCLEAALVDRDRAEGLSRESDPTRRVRSWEETRRQSLDRSLLAALDPLGRHELLWVQLAPSPSGRAEDQLARLRLARAAALVVLGGPFRTVQAAELPLDPLVADRRIRLEGSTAGFALAAGTCEEDAGESSGHSARGTELRGGVLASEPAGTGEIALLCARSTRSQSAVEVGLHWILRHQTHRGELVVASTCPDHGGRAPTLNAVTTPRSTALGALALLGAGYTPQNRARVHDGHDGQVHDFGKQLEGALASFEEIGLADAADVAITRPTTLEEDALVALALSEAYGISSARRLRSPAEATLDRLAKRLARGDRPEAARERATAAWVALALASAKTSGLEVSPTALDHARSWFADLERAAVEAPGGALALVPAAILAAADGTAKTDAARARFERIAGFLEKEREITGEDAALACSVVATKWDAASGRRLRGVRDVLCRRQAVRSAGCADGSFPVAGADLGTETALSLLALEAAYGYASSPGYRIGRAR